VNDGYELIQGLGEIRLKSSMDIAYAARLLPTGDAAQVTAVHGERSGTLANLVVQRGAGLGGKALTLMRPVSVTSYRQAAGITHDYDAQVLGEGIETLSAFPVVVGGVSRFVIYLGLRTQARVEDRWYDSVVPLVRQFGSDLARSTEDPAASARPGGVDTSLSRTELRMALDELTELAGIAGNELVRRRILRLKTRLVRSAPDVCSPDVGLTRREVDVLVAIAQGLSNRAAGDKLGLVESTVKTYLKSAMRKLHVANRVQAISSARELGLID
jgi:DNA-binding CsgD family transcriptional regulator